MIIGLKRILKLHRNKYIVKYAICILIIIIKSYNLAKCDSHTQLTLTNI